MRTGFQTYEATVKKQRGSMMGGSTLQHLFCGRCGMVAASRLSLIHIYLILVTAFFVKAGTTYYEYRKHGQIEWTGLILLFAGLVLTLTAPLYIWTIAGV